MAPRSLQPIPAIRKLYASNPCAKAILDQFALRQQDRLEVSVDRLQQLLTSDGHEFPRPEIIEVLRALEATGAGKFVVGRKGHESRFARTVRLSELGRAARGEGTDGALDRAVQAAEPNPTGDPVNHRFVLRPGFVVGIALPGDLSASEATRLADFIKTLPFQIAG